jgi:hypothetical protein
MCATILPNQRNIKSDMKTLENNRQIRFFNILMLVLLILSIIDKEKSRVKFWGENQNKIK